MVIVAAMGEAARERRRNLQQDDVGMDAEEQIGDGIASARHGRGGLKLADWDGDQEMVEIAGDGIDGEEQQRWRRKNIGVDGIAAAEGSAGWEEQRNRHGWAAAAAARIGHGSSGVGMGSELGGVVGVAAEQETHGR